MSNTEAQNKKAGEGGRSLNLFTDREVPAVRELFLQGKSQEYIVDCLNRDGYTNERGGPVSRSSLSRWMVKNGMAYRVRGKKSRAARRKFEKSLLLQSGDEKKKKMKASYRPRKSVPKVDLSSSTQARSEKLIEEFLEIFTSNLPPSSQAKLALLLAKSETGKE